MFRGSFLTVIMTPPMIIDVPLCNPERYIVHFVWEIFHFICEYPYCNQGFFQFFIEKAISWNASRLIKIVDVFIMVALLLLQLSKAHVRYTFCEIKRCEESKRTLKNQFASRLAEFDTTLKLLRITDQWYIVPLKFRFGRNRDFLALLSLPLAGGPREGKRFNASWWLMSPASFHTSSDNRERNTQKWNSNNRMRTNFGRALATTYTGDRPFHNLQYW